MTIPTMGWLDTIVNVNWGGGYYVLFQALVDATSGTPNVSISLGPKSKLVYERKDHYHTGGGTTTQYVVWLPHQVLQIHGDSMVDQLVPCHGHFTYWTDATNIDLGYADVNAAYASSAAYNGLGGWFNNSTTHPSSKNSAFTSAPSDIVAFGAPFSGFTPGLPFTAGTAAAFAAALGGMSTQFGGWANGPVPTEPGTFPCDNITGDQPHAPLEFSSWSVGTRTITDPGTTFLEYVALIQVTGTPPADGEEVFTADMSGAPGWNTFVSSYKKQKHQIAGGNAGPNPYGLSDHNVWYPLLPYLDWLDQTDIDGGGTQTVSIANKGVLSTS